MIITTSWDDGHPLDSKLVDLLAKYNIKATFYIPLSNTEYIVMERSQLKEIAKNYEIGGHTVNHLYLNTLSTKEAQNEIANCKSELEQITGEAINAFCFPGGKYSVRDIELITHSGFKFGRTTKLLQTAINTETRLMHTSVQAFNHSSLALLKHCIKRFMITEMLDCKAFLPFDANFIKLSEHYLNKDETQVFHLWGHSWEIEKYNLWQELEVVFKLLSEIPDSQFMNNTECWNYFNNQK